MSTLPQVGAARLLQPRRYVVILGSCDWRKFHDVLFLVADANLIHQDSICISHVVKAQRFLYLYCISEFAHDFLQFRYIS